MKRRVKEGERICWRAANFGKHLRFLDASVKLYGTRWVWLLLLQVYENVLQILFPHLSKYAYKRTANGETADWGFNPPRHRTSHSLHWSDYSQLHYLLRQNWTQSKILSRLLLQCSSRSYFTMQTFLQLNPSGLDGLYLFLQRTTHNLKGKNIFKCSRKPSSTI